MGRVLEEWHVFVAGGLIQLPSLAKGNKTTEIGYRSYSIVFHHCKTISVVLFQEIQISLTPVNVPIKGVNKTRV